MFGYFDPLNEEADPEVVRLDQRSCRKQFGAFVNGQRIYDGVLVLDGEQSHPLFEGVLPGGRHFLQEAKLQVRSGGNDPLPALDGGADGPAGEKLQMRPGDRVEQIPANAFDADDKGGDAPGN